MSSFAGFKNLNFLVAVVLLFISSCDGKSGTVLNCGNKFLDPGEECDGNQFRYSDCESAGFTSGSLSCNSDCTIDFSQCLPQNPLCGNNTVDEDEECDGTEFQGLSCTDFGYQSGLLKCLPSCNFDISNCYGNCPDECLLGEKRCQDNKIIVCSASSDCNGWVKSEDCTLQSAICIDDGYGNAVCASGCQYPCTIEGISSCSDDGASRKVCTRNDENECLGWTFESCGDYTCIELDESNSICDLPCESSCDPENISLKCEGSQIWNCTEVVTDCYQWTLHQSCDENFTCSPVNFSCIPQGSGNTCSDPMIVSSVPFHLYGSNFNADFTDDLTSDATPYSEGCILPTSGSELWLEIIPDENDILWIENTGSHPLNISIKTECTADCIASSPNNIIYRVPSMDPVYVYFESWDGAYTSPYNINISTVDNLTEGSECTANPGEGVCEEGTICIVDYTSTTSRRCTWVFEGNSCEKAMETPSGIFTSNFQGLTDDWDAGIFEDSDVDAFFSFTPSTDATFQISLENTGFLTNLYVASDCSNSSSVLFSQQSSGDISTELYLVSGTPVYIIAEKSNPPYVKENPYSFNIRIMEIATTETSLCSDLMDNDLDGFIDCDDSDCFGTENCETELNCDDLMDNDLDGLTDCDDPDCILNESCVEKHGIYEIFTADGTSVDLTGYTLTFTPSGLFDYTLSVTEDATVLSRDIVDSIPVYDDEVISLDLPFEFTFYGFNYSRVYISSNGFISFTMPESSLPFESDVLLFTYHIIAVFWDDLNRISSGDQFDILTGNDDNEGDFWGITFLTREYNNSANILHAQLLLYADGRIKMSFQDVSVSDGLTGISSPGGGEIPPPTNLVP
ncbi:MAG: hypothetical protein JXR95_05060 [Deltaproteobacteria bacterium]|nr:hypothetical protein [Deltaproteobacteria bacterium]